MKRSTDKERMNWLSHNWNRVGRLDIGRFYSCGKSFPSLRKTIDHAIKIALKRKRGNQ